MDTSSGHQAALLQQRAIWLPGPSDGELAGPGSESRSRSGWLRNSRCPWVDLATSPNMQEIAREVKMILMSLSD